MAELLTEQEWQERATLEAARTRGAGTETATVSAAEQSTERAEGKSELFYQKILSQVQTQTTDDTDASDTELDAKAILDLADMKTQVERLVRLAEVKGVVYAVQVARKLDFYVLDQVHDQLANHFYDTLLGKGLIEKE